MSQFWEKCVTDWLTDGETDWMTDGETDWLTDNLEFIGPHASVGPKSVRKCKRKLK